MTPPDVDALLAAQQRADVAARRVADLVAAGHRITAELEFARDDYIAARTVEVETRAAYYAAR